MKTLNITSTDQVFDVVVCGNPDRWVLICKASSDSEGWMRSTKAMNVIGGCLIQVSTHTSEGVAEALTFVPNTYVSDLV